MEKALTPRLPPPPPLPATPPAAPPPPRTPALSATPLASRPAANTRGRRNGSVWHAAKISRSSSSTHARFMSRFSSFRSRRRHAAKSGRPLRPPRESFTRRCCPQLLRDGSGHPFTSAAPGANPFHRLRGKGFQLLL